MGITMKAIKIILGIVFGHATVISAVLLVWELREFVRVCRTAGYSPHAFTQTGGLIGFVCISATITLWSFGSAFREPTAKVSRRWCQFSLRSLLLFGPLATICIVWVVLAVRDEVLRDERQIEIANAIVESGGRVFRWKPNLPAFKVQMNSDSWLKFAASRPNLEDFEADELTITGQDVTDTGLDYVKAWRQLRFLHLVNTRISDRGVRELQDALPNCRIDRR
jgi:hypothetical protein